MQPYLYTVVEQEKLHEMLEAFYACLDLPIQVIDDMGNILESCGEETDFCKSFQKHLPAGDTCEKIHVTSSKRAISLGEPYTFCCHANLNHIVFPLINKDAFWGSIIVGPFLLEPVDALLISDIAKRYPGISTPDLLALYEASDSVQVISPALATQISRLLYFMFYNLITDGKQKLMDNQGKYYQQSKISESIQMYKNFTKKKKGTTYPYEKEKDLITKVKTGNAKEAKSILNDLLGYVLFSEGNNLDVVKSRAIELSSLLSRAAIEGGAATDTILKINNMFLKSAQQINSLEELCYKLQELVEVFTESMFNYTPTKNNEIIKKAMSYISDNFASNITLDDVARHVHLNPAYFSTIFKQSCGSSFKEYLNMVRIEESKRLLANTDYSVVDIAVATGFMDQSYFSKVFKKYTGLTPKQYR